MDIKRVQFLILILAGGVLIGVLLLCFHLTQPIPNVTVGPTVTFGETTVSVSLADTPEEQEQGLSDTVSLPQNSGKLFIFQAPAQPGFWMKDMHYPLDIIWISSDWKITDISEHVDPASYPTIFYPHADVQYVLEVNADFAKMHGIEIGQSATFKK